MSPYSFILEPKSTIRFHPSFKIAPYESLNIDKSKQLLSSENITKKLNMKGENAR